MAHGDDSEERLEVFEALLAGLGALEEDHAKLYADAVFAVLPAAARAYLEALMTTSVQYQSDFARRYVAEGAAQAKVQAVVDVLDERGIEVADEVRERIARCVDLDQLDVWIRRAARIASIDELFS
jgi:hypothetical protein